MPHEERDYYDWVTLPDPHNRLERWPQVCFWQAFILLSGTDWTGCSYRDGLVMLDALEEYGLLTIKQKRCLQRQFRQPTSRNGNAKGIIWSAEGFLSEVYGDELPPMSYFWWYHSDYWQSQPWDDFRNSLKKKA